MWNEHSISISHEWIYQYLLQDKRQGGDLHRHLRCQKLRRKRYGAHRHPRGQLRNRTSIDQRPAIAERRTRIGDWELDTIIGRGQKRALVSLSERKSRLTLLAKLSNREAKTLNKAIRALLEPLSHRVHTLTSDNRKEFAEHEAIANAVGARFYFAHPYASWQPGLNENTNALVDSISRNNAA